MQAHATRQTIFGVRYTHLSLGPDGDLYLTEHGIPHAECLLPQNYWLDKQWFRENATRLSGTSTVYRLITRAVNGSSKEIVLKWNRMGQDVPVEDDHGLGGARFNSPFEEFSYVAQLSDAAAGTDSAWHIHRPLAIYVPTKRVEMRRIGRRESSMKALIEKHVEIELDTHRTYAVIYEWMPGVDATQAHDEELIDDDSMRRLTLDGDAEMGRLGFEVRDRKPHHIIIRHGSDGSPLRGSEGELLCGLIDFELLAPTPERELEEHRKRRTEYLKRQRDRFLSKPVDRVPEHLSRATIMGVDYVHGHCECTGGALWVVGKDPELFEYFLPERWESSARTRLSSYSEIYYTLTKDHINLVWKVSKVGVQPDVDPFKAEEERIIDFGYNSPFEEVALSVYLMRAGIQTIYPRAIYMTGVKTEIEDALSDPRRYETHAEYRTPDGAPALRAERDYITIWGYWNGPDEKLAEQDSDHYRSIDALRAVRDGLITVETYRELMQRACEAMLAAGVEDLNLRGSHLLLGVLARTGHLIIDADGLPEVRICSFELLRRLGGAGV